MEHQDFEIREASNFTRAATTRNLDPVHHSSAQFYNPRLSIDPSTGSALSALQITAKMITKFITEVTAKFNPFSPCAKPARLFLTYLPPNARATGMKINTTLLPRTAAVPSLLKIKFSASAPKRLCLTFL
jgi:hypothetical protein